MQPTQPKPKEAFGETTEQAKTKKTSKKGGKNVEYAPGTGKGAKVTKIAPKQSQQGEAPRKASIKGQVSRQVSEKAVKASRNASEKAAEPIGSPHTPLKKPVSQIKGGKPLSNRKISNFTPSPLASIQEGDEVHPFQVETSTKSRTSQTSSASKTPPSRVQSSSGHVDAVAEDVLGEVVYRGRGMVFRLGGPKKESAEQISHEKPFGPVHEIPKVLTFTNQTITFDTLKGIDRNVTKLIFRDCEFIDGSIKALQNFSNLTELDLQGSKSNDESLNWLPALGKLQTLRLGKWKNVEFSPAIFQNKLQKLETLDLSGSGVKEDDLQNLHLFKKLNDLDISNCKNIQIVLIPPPPAAKKRYLNIAV